MSDGDNHGEKGRNLYFEINASAMQSAAGLWGHALSNPARTLEIAAKYWVSQLELLTRAKVERSDDKRFDEDGWDQPYFAHLRSCWQNLEQISNDWLDETSEDEDIHHRRRKYMINFLLAGASPKNFALTNPEAFQQTMNEGGLNLVRGMQHLVEDLTSNAGLPSAVDPDAYRLGEDIAVTDGSVVFRDELSEIIQFKPLTKKVHKTPVLLVWSVINRYYVLDLNHERSVLRQLLQQGFQVFLQSWKSPGAEDAHWSLEHYAKATHTAFNVTRDIAGTDNLNVMPVCAGAYPTYAAMLMAQASGDTGVSGLVSLVSAIDNQTHDTMFGLIGTTDTIESAKANARQQNGFSSDALSWSLSLMQPDRMLFPYFYEGYVLGKRREPTEVAYWLADQVNISTGFYEDLLDYITMNAFTDPDKTTVDEQPIRLDQLETDLLLVSAIHDNLMPWRAAYRTINHVECPVEFVLTNGGHITPMTAKSGDARAGYWTNKAASKTATADEWLEGADWTQESWLGYLGPWLKKRSGPKVAAPKDLGNEKFPEICAAPGKYALG